MFGEPRYTVTETGRASHCSPLGSLHRPALVPRRQRCLAEHRIRAPRHAAELAVWQASGRDSLRSVRPK